MNGYICTKTVTLGGTTYQKGEPISAEAVLPSRVRALTREGYISPQNSAPAEAKNQPQEPQNTPAPIVIPITKNGGVMELLAAPDDIAITASIMQLNAEEAIKAIGEVSSEEALILIDALESRKTVKAATAARAAVLQEPETEMDGQEGKTGDA